MATKVLVFESDSAFAGELRNEFGKLGCTTTVVEDGSVGLQQATAERPDLILLSIELPRMNGCVRRARWRGGSGRWRRMV